MAAPLVDDAEQLLQPTFAAKHAKAALKHFQEMTVGFQQSAWEEAIAKGGKFIEAALKACMSMRARHCLRQGSSRRVR